MLDDFRRLKDKHNKLRLSVQGVKSQQGELRKKIARLNFCMQLAFVWMGVFSATLIVSAFFR